ncbi:MAG: PAS domain S-box protein [Thermodesulfobacteriota bacterium]
MKTKQIIMDEIFQLVVESMPSGILITDQNGKIILVNKQLEKLFGYGQNELISKSVEQLVPGKYKKNHKKYRTKFSTKPDNRPMGAGRDLFGLRKDGREIPVEIGLSHIKTKKGVLIFATIIDITERVKIDNALRESEQTLQAIIDNSTDAILVYDNDSQIITFNKEANKLFHFKKGFINKISEIIPPEYEFSFSKLLSEAKNGKSFVDYEMEKIIHQGKRLSVSIGLVYVEGTKGLFIETIRDITDRVKLRNKILDFEKAQIVSQMSEGIAHHMGTPLASMLLRIQMMKDDISNINIDGNLQKSFKEKLDSIESQIFYGQKVMQRLLKFASKPKSEKTKVNIPSLIRELIEIIKPLSLKSATSVEIKLKDDVNVLGDSDMLELVLSDLCMNAIDSMPGGGKLTIEVSNNKDKNGFSKISFTDKGTGIPKKILPFIFEPFFSTKPAGKGTGLGLAVAKRIIQDHGGNISIDSIEGKGTKVTINIPTIKEVG